MALELSWIGHMAFVVLLFAALSSWIATWRRGWSRSARWSAAVSVLAPSALFASSTLALRFDRGVEHSPWIPATTLFLGSALALILIAHRGLGGNPPRAASWPRKALFASAGVALLLNGMVIRKLEQDARQRVLALSLELDRTAAIVRAERSQDDEGTMPMLALLLEDWQEAEGAIVPQQFDSRSFVPDRAGLELADEELGAWLASVEPRLEELHAAAALPGIGLEQSEPRRDDAAGNRLGFQLFDVAQVLRLDALVRAARADFAGAWRDLHTLEAIARHYCEGPSLADAGFALPMRTLAIDAAAWILGSELLASEDLRAFPFEAMPLLAAGLPRAMIQEEADGLAGIARGGSSASVALLELDEFALGALVKPVLAHLYEAFMLEEDVASYRQGMGELRELAAGAPAVVRAYRWDRMHTRARGLLARGLTPMVQPLFLVVHQGDARLALLLAALPLTRHRLRTGAWPTSIEQLAPDERATLPPDLVMALDGETLVIARSEDPAETVRPLELRLGR